jgi:sigma-B regulation protein RsbU (phosphoserine phosphatase)
MLAPVPTISEMPLRSHPREDLILVMLGSIAAAIGLAALIVLVSRWRRGDRALLWFGLFAAPYGIRLLTSAAPFSEAFHPARFWLFVGRFVDLASIIPALLLFEDFYGKGWRSSVRWLMSGYTVFAIVAFAAIAIRHDPDFVPAAGIGTVFLFPAILLLDRVMGYRPPPLPDRRALTVGLLALFLTFAHDRLASAGLFGWRAHVEPYGLFLLICCLGYVAVRRILANERHLISLSEEMRAAARIQSSILPRTVPESESLHIAVRYSPMTAVAGDFYDFVRVRPNRLGILVADVAGHGVPAALVASMIKVAASSHAEVATEPEKVIAGLNSTLCAQAEGQYATAVYVS